jgi:hypothetical protein
MGRHKKDCKCDHCVNRGKMLAANKPGEQKKETPNVTPDVTPE